MEDQNDDLDRNRQAIGLAPLGTYFNTYSFVADQTVCQSSTPTHNHRLQRHQPIDVELLMDAPLAGLYDRELAENETLDVSIHI